jgi:C1A family cysteine protease
MRSKLFILMSITVLLVAAGCRISGTVTQDGHGAAGVTVVLMGPVVKTAVTGSDGRYVFDYLWTGSYNVAVDECPALPERLDVAKTGLFVNVDGIDFEKQIPGPMASFDLREIGAVTPVRSQKGGTCWTHATMAAIESNLLMNNAWQAAGEEGLPDLAEYHLDWWNGFNKNYNDDLTPPNGSGLDVHMGGDYRVASAYITRGEGVVRNVDGQSYLVPPTRQLPNYHYFYVRDIEWFVLQPDLGNIGEIKENIVANGAMATCLCSDSSFIDSRYTHYQPPESAMDPNHGVTIVGWNDYKITRANERGAWLCKNSWGENSQIGGFFWISYFDKHAGHDPEMGTVAFKGTEPMPYDSVYYHDYHGWRDTIGDCSEAMNSFVARQAEYLKAVSFATAADDVGFRVAVYGDFEAGEPLDLLADVEGTIGRTGFHTVDLPALVALSQGDDFYIYVRLSHGGHPIDRTSLVRVLLDGPKFTLDPDEDWSDPYYYYDSLDAAEAATLVESSAGPGQSYYRNGGEWLDLYYRDLGEYSGTANFCIKGLAVKEVD